MLAEQSKDDQRLSVRKKGEEKLTESQVKARRSRERDKRLAPARGKVSSLESKIAIQIEEFLELKNYVDEASNTRKTLFKNNLFRLGESIFFATFLMIQFYNMMII